MRRALTLATHHGPLPCTLAVPEAPAGVVLLAEVPGDPRRGLLEETLLHRGLAVLAPVLLSPREQHFPDRVHNVPLLTERILHALEFADRDGDTAGLPAGLYATAPLAPAAIRAAARRDALVAAVACHGGIIDLAGLQYLELLTAPLLMVFAADDEHGPATFRRAAPHLGGPWETLTLAAGGSDAAAVVDWLASRVAARPRR